MKKSGNKKYIIMSSGVVGVFPPVFYLWHRDRAPVTGRGRIMMIKTRDSIEQGAKAAAKVDYDLYLIKDYFNHRNINGITFSLLKFLI